MVDDRSNDDSTEAPHPPPDDGRPPGPSFQGISDFDTGVITWIDMSPDELDAAS